MYNVLTDRTCRRFLSETPLLAHRDHSGNLFPNGQSEDCRIRHTRMAQAAVLCLPISGFLSTGRSGDGYRRNRATLHAIL